MSVLLLVFLLLCYLSGAVPFGFLLTRRSTGLNILEHGSGNTGSTNVGRIAGKVVAFRVQILDMLKGLIPVAILLLLKTRGLLEMPDYYIFLAAFSTIVGHNFSVFLGGKGGKGVNTSLGSTLLLAPLEVVFAVVIYFVVKSLFKFVSAGSLALAVTLPVSSILLHGKSIVTLYLLLVCLMIFIRHRSNIARLLSGKEKL